jgi:hypothetical protein
MDKRCEWVAEHEGQLFEPVVDFDAKDLVDTL